MFELSCHTSGSRTSSSQAMPVSLRAHSAACSAAMFHNAHGTPPRSGCDAQNVRSSAYAVMTDSSVTGIIVWYRRSASVATNSLAAAAEIRNSTFCRHHGGMATADSRRDPHDASTAIAHTHHSYQPQISRGRKSMRQATPESLRPYKWLYCKGICRFKLH